MASFRPPPSIDLVMPEEGEPHEDVCCDGCNKPITLADMDDLGKGVFLWVRGDERRYDEVPLCPNCGTALGMAVLARYAMEEEEG